MPSSQEDINRQFAAAVSALEVATENLKQELTDVKESIKELVKEIAGIKKIAVFMAIGLVGNMDPQHWVNLLAHVFK